MEKWKIVVGVVLMVAFSSCLRRNERPRWNTDILAPLVDAKLSLSNFFNDTLKSVDENKLISVVYSQKIADFNTDTLLPLNGQKYIKSILLKDFELNSSSVVYYYSLREVLQNTTFTDPSISNLIRLLLLFGSLNASIPAPGLVGLVAGPIIINADNVFRSADVISGFLEIKVTNENAFALENIDYTLTNREDRAVIGRQFIPRLNPGETRVEVVNLAGKRIEGTLEFFLNNLDIPPTATSVNINVNKGIKLVVTARELKVNYAEAVFPKQDVLNDTITTTLEKVGDFKLKNASASSGFVSVYVESTAPDTIFFTYKLWDARVAGDTFKVVRQKVLPAEEGGSSKQLFVYPLTDFFINLSGPTGDSVNYFRSQIMASFDSTGRLVKIDGNDSLRVEILVYDVVPKFAKGYFGKQEFLIGPSDVAFSVFNKIKSGSIEFDEVGLDLRVLNGAGLPAKMEVKKIVLENTENNTTQELRIDQPTLAILPAVESPFQSKESVFSLNKNNSNLNSIISILPNKIKYEALIIANPEGDNGLYDNFLSSESKVQAFVDIRVPLSFIASQLTLKDSVAIKSDLSKTSNGLQSGKLTLWVNNGYPLGFKIRVEFRDDKNELVDTLETPSEVVPAEMGSNSPRVSAPKITEFDFFYNQERLQKLFRSKKVIFTAVFNTPNDGKAYRIFNDYTAEIKLLSDFQFEVK